MPQFGEPSDGQISLRDAMGAGLTQREKLAIHLQQLLDNGRDIAAIDAAAHDFWMEYAGTTKFLALVPNLEQVTLSGGASPKIHMLLHHHYRYPDGFGSEADPRAALHHLNNAVSIGDEQARLLLGKYLVGAEDFSLIPPDADRGLDVLRDLEQNAECRIMQRFARRALFIHIAQRCKLGDVDKEDVAIVERYAEDPGSYTDDYYHLAMFFAGEATTKDFEGPAYRRSRELLIKGMRYCTPDLRAACEAQLRAWGGVPVPELPTAAVRATPETHAAAPGSLTTTEKVVESIKVTGVVGGIGAILFVWAAIGTFLLSMAAVINAIMVPVILVLVVIFAVLSALRRK